MIRDYFSLNAWGPGGGEFWIVRLKLDWYSAHGEWGWYAADVGMLGFCASLTYWPKGKWTGSLEGMPSFEFSVGTYIADGVNDLKVYDRALTEDEIRSLWVGREHGEAGE